MLRVYIIDNTSSNNTKEAVPHQQTLMTLGWCCTSRWLSSFRVGALKHDCNDCYVFEWDKTLVLAIAMRSPTPERMSGLCKGRRVPLHPTQVEAQLVHAT